MVLTIEELGVVLDLQIELLWGSRKRGIEVAILGSE